jgi:hypothetical protein
LFGQGASGAAAVAGANFSVAIPAGGGSGGGSGDRNLPNWGLYGAGSYGYGVPNSIGGGIYGGDGRRGAVRIIWGAGRSFPNNAA